MYSYEIQKSVHASTELDVHKEIDTLHLLAQHDGPTEIGSLFLSPDYWGGGHGRLLSMSRFLFLAEFRDPLLPKEAQDVIGKVHSNTEPALAMLLKEGFENRGLVDLFDGGPTIECELENIRAVRESKSGTVGAIVETVDDGSQQLISNSRMDFRTCLGDISWAGDVATIDQVSALRLGLKKDDAIRSVNLKPSES